jgi:hypothetical protein
MGSLDFSPLIVQCNWWRVGKTLSHLYHGGQLVFFSRWWCRWILLPGLWRCCMCSSGVWIYIHGKSLCARCLIFHATSIFSDVLSVASTVWMTHIVSDFWLPDFLWMTHSCRVKCRVGSHPCVIGGAIIFASIALDGCDVSSRFFYASNFYRSLCNPDG